MSERSRDRDGRKSRGQDLFGLGLACVGGFSAVSIVMALGGQESSHPLTVPVGFLIGAVGHWPGLVLALGLAGLGVTLFLRPDQIPSTTHLLGCIGCSAGLSLMLGAIRADLGGAVGELLPRVLGPTAGLIVGLLSGLAVLVGSAWAAWLAAILRGPRIPTHGALVPTRQADEDGVSAAEAQALQPEDKPASPPALPRREADVRLHGGVPAGATPLQAHADYGASDPIEEPRAATGRFAAVLTEAERFAVGVHKVPGIAAPIAETEEPTTAVPSEPLPAPSWESAVQPPFSDPGSESGDFEEEYEDEEQDEAELEEAAELEDEEEGEEEGEAELEDEEFELEEEDEDAEEEEAELEKAAELEDGESELESELEEELEEEEDGELEDEEESDPEEEAARAEPARTLRPPAPAWEQVGLFDDAEDDAEEPAVPVAPEAGADFVLVPSAAADPDPDPEPEEARSMGELVLEAGDLILEENRVAVSMLQRRFTLDFEQACDVLDALQELGLIGPYVGGRNRDILLTREEWQALASQVAAS